MDEEKEGVLTESEKRKTVICRTCGAEFDASIPNCPYCGTMNLPAAETAYMGKLEGIRGGLEELGTLGKKETRAHLGRLTKKLLIAVGVIAVAAIMVVAILLREEKKEAASEQAEYLWQQEGFAKLDEYYDAGAYEEMVAYYKQSSDEGHRFWHYRHKNFCEFYDLILTAQDTLLWQETYGSARLLLFVDEVSLYKLETMNDLSEDERAVLEERRRPLLEDFNERFGLSDKELDEFRRMLQRDGFVSITACERFFEERGWEK